MKRATFVGKLLFCAAVVGALLLSSGPVAAQDNNTDNKDDRFKRPPTPYNPYPAGSLPAALVSEIARVQREVTVVENRAIAQWKALRPPVLTGQPPTQQGTGMRANQLLGKLMNFDLNMSPFKNRACGFCHMPYAGFSGPIPSVNLTMVAYPGSYEFRAGKRTAQRYTYSPLFPVFNYNQTQAQFAGG